MATTTVRIHPRTRDALARLSKKRNVSTADLLAELVERREQDDALEQMNAAFARQREDGDAWAAERAEREAWDATLIDGLVEL
jgi:predicted DNA-binding ribbon-helix-helix protein